MDRVNSLQGLFQDSLQFKDPAALAPCSKNARYSLCIVFELLLNMLRQLLWSFMFPSYFHAPSVATKKVPCWILLRATPREDLVVLIQLPICKFSSCRRDLLRLQQRSGREKFRSDTVSIKSTPRLIVLPAFSKLKFWRYVPNERAPIPDPALASWNREAVSSTAFICQQSKLALIQHMFTSTN